MHGMNNTMFTYGFSLRATLISPTFRVLKFCKVIDLQKKTFGPNREEVTRGWRKLYNEELHDAYCLTNMTRDLRSSGILRSVEW